LQREINEIEIENWQLVMQELREEERGAQQRSRLMAFGGLEHNFIEDQPAS